MNYQFDAPKRWMTIGYDDRQMPIRKFARPASVEPHAQARHEAERRRAVIAEAVKHASAEPQVGASQAYEAEVDRVTRAAMVQRLMERGATPQQAREYFPNKWRDGTPNTPRQSAAYGLARAWVEQGSPGDPNANYRKKALEAQQVYGRYSQHERNIAAEVLTANGTGKFNRRGNAAVAQALTHDGRGLQPTGMDQLLRIGKETGIAAIVDHHRRSASEAEVKAARARRKEDHSTSVRNTIKASIAEVNVHRQFGTRPAPQY